MAGMNNDEQQQQQEQSDTPAIIPVCTCDIRCGGCTCGAMERERAARAAQEIEPHPNAGPLTQAMFAARVERERAAQAGRLECLLPGDGERMVAEIAAEQGLRPSNFELTEYCPNCTNKACRLLDGCLYCPVCEATDDLVTIHARGWIVRPDSDLDAVVTHFRTFVQKQLARGYGVRVTVTRQYD